MCQSVFYKILRVNASTYCRNLLRRTFLFNFSLRIDLCHVVRMEVLGIKIESSTICQMKINVQI